MNTRQLQTDKNQKLYHALLGILLVCALAMMMLLSYWACKYSYYGAVDGRTRGVLVGDKTWAHIAVFLAASLCAMGIDKVLMKKDKSQQEKICLCTLIQRRWYQPLQQPQGTFLPLLLHYKGLPL